MNAAAPKAFRATHSVASTIHAAMAERGITAEQLAVAIVESPSFLNGILTGEDGLDRLVNVALLQKIADATGRTLTFKVFPEKRGNATRSVKSGKGSPE